jgi:hypothetical protein
LPFKYHLSGNRDITGATTVGPYLGYHATTSTLGGLAVVGFGGASDISVTQQVNGQSTTQSLYGFSYGAGVIATVKGSFQLGAVIGVDHVNKSANYQYNDKPWLAVELGYAFLQ